MLFVLLFAYWKYVCFVLIILSREVISDKKKCMQKTKEKKNEAQTSLGYTTRLCLIVFIT